MCEKDNQENWLNGVIAKNFTAITQRQYTGLLFVHDLLLHKSDARIRHGLNKQDLDIYTAVARDMVSSEELINKIIDDHSRQVTHDYDKKTIQFLKSLSI